MLSTPRPCPPSNKKSYTPWKYHGCVYGLPPRNHEDSTECTLQEVRSSQVGRLLGDPLSDCKGSATHGSGGISHIHCESVWGWHFLSHTFGKFQNIHVVGLINHDRRKIGVIYSWFCKHGDWASSRHRCISLQAQDKFRMFVFTFRLCFREGRLSCHIAGVKNPFSCQLHVWRSRLRALRAE